MWYKLFWGEKGEHNFKSILLGCEYRIKKVFWKICIFGGALAIGSQKSKIERKSWFFTTKYLFQKFYFSIYCKQYIWYKKGDNHLFAEIHCFTPICHFMPEFNEKWKKLCIYPLKAHLSSNLQNFSFLLKSCI